MSDENNILESQQLAQLLSVYRKDVSVFAQQVFGITLTSKQVEIADAFQNNRLVTVRGAVSIGKSAIMSILAWHNLICYPEVLVTLWGPNESNLRDGVVKAMHELYDAMAEPFKSQYECGREKFERKINSASCYAQMRLASKERPDAARGLHQKRNVVLCDESTEIEDNVLEILMNVLSDPDPKILLISNPSRRSGFFFKTHTDEDIAKHWVQVHATIYDAPNYDPERTEQQIAQYGGPTSHRYRPMVLGEWPLSDEEGLINREHIDFAIANECFPPDNAPIVWGLDPAGQGADSSVLCMRQDNKVLDFKQWRGLNPTQLSHTVRDLYEKTPKNKRPAVISVDANGLGYGAYSGLKDLGLPAYECKFAGTPTRNPDRYVNVRAQLYAEMAEWFAGENVQIPNIPKLVEELAIVRYEDGSGKIKLEKKELIKKRLGRSPDYADALGLTFAVSPSRYSSKFAWSKPISYDFLRSYE